MNKSVITKSLFYAGVFSMILSGCMNEKTYSFTEIGHSIEPTIMNNEKLQAKLFSEDGDNAKLQRGDIIVFEEDPNYVPDPDHPIHGWAKRIISLPGESIEALINGKALDESSYLKEDIVEDLLEEYKGKQG